MRFKNISDITMWRLCIGCGACAYACPERAISLIDVVKDGIRPYIMKEVCKSCGECLKVCPGLGISHVTALDAFESNTETARYWGPIKEVWEGFAADPDFRFHGSSGGLATALAAYCLEHEEIDTILHAARDEAKSWQNRTVVSRSRKDLLNRTGSRYSPASPCEAFKTIETCQRGAVFIGKPCDIQGLRKAEKISTELPGKVSLAIGIFCAGTPSTQGILDLLKLHGIDLEQVSDLRYRGRGWPGMFSVYLNGHEEPSLQIPYLEAWGFLQQFRPYRCHLCPDATSEFADISCGDPWYRDRDKDDLGYSLVLVRTEAGRIIISRAIEHGYVVLQHANPDIIEKSQKNVLEKRRAIWGRMLMMKFFGIPTPKFEGFHLFENWCKLSLKDKARSTLGTGRRIISRKYYLPLVNTERTNISDNDEK
jgi:coenzyme F420 hydrogenase subunit beta